MTIYFEDITVGDKFFSASRTVEPADIVGFAELSGDFNPLHVDRDWVRAHTSYDDCIAHGLLMLSMTSGLPTTGMDEWQIEAYMNVERRMAAPTYAGDTVRAIWTVTSARRSGSRPGSGIVTVGVELHNDRGDVVQSGADTYLIAARPVIVA